MSNLLSNALAPAAITPGLGLTVNNATIWNTGLAISVPTTIVFLVANTTNYVFFNLQSNALQSNTSGFPSSSTPIIPIATVTTANLQIGNIIDSRPDILVVATGGGGGSSPNFADAEVPSGLINSSNTVYTLANTPNPTACLELFYDGVLQIQGTDYTLSLHTITYTNPPLTGRLHEAFYRF